MLSVNILPRKYHCAVPLYLVFFPIGTIAEGAPVIPISAQLKYNIDVVCEYITKKIPVPLRDFSSEPRLIGTSILLLFCAVSDLRLRTYKAVL